jgi:hypothetical protein
MTIEQLWLEMEAESEMNVAWLTRFAGAQSGPRFLVGLEQATKARALLVQVPSGAMPPRRDWPECRGLELLSVALDAKPHLAVRLRDSTCADVFTALAEDVASRVSAHSLPHEAAAELLGRLRRWQQFLSGASEGLGVEAQRGLWGELHVLRTHLLPALGGLAAVEGWKGSAAAHQDFQFPDAAMEVKTTAAKQPQSVRITSERQLDNIGVGALFLHVLAVDEREVPEGEATAGVSLPSLVAGIRTDFGGHTVLINAFNDRLLERGWLDAHAARYEGKRLTVRKELTFRVEPGFPRIVESDLPSGVGDVTFALSLAACEPFAVPLTTFFAALSSSLLSNNSKPSPL